MPRKLCVFAILLSYLAVPLLAQHFKPPHWQHTKIVPNTPASGPSTAQWTSGFNDFDAPHLSSINASTFEWWWFGAIDTSGASLHVVFFTSTPTAFPLTAAANGSVLGIEFTAVWSNGTVADIILPADTAKFSWGSEGDSILAEYKGAGMKAGFTSSPDLSHFIIFFDAPAYNLSGTVDFERTAPSHSACTVPLGPGQPLEVTPHFAWDNAHPAAGVSANVHVQGSPFNLEGALGYHDHNWGDRPFLTLVGFWYWGHAHFGPYSIVWAEAQTSDGTTYPYGYLAEGDILLASTCNVADVTVRPYGSGAQYPPTAEHWSFDYLIVEIDLQEKGTFIANVSGISLGDEVGIYHFWIGEASGGWKGIYWIG